MNARERFLEVATFGKPDKIPLALADVRPATRRRWIQEGMPENVRVPEYLSFGACNLGSVNVVSYPSEGFKSEPNPSVINLGPIPPFEYRVLGQNGRYRVWVDSLGITQMGFLDDWKDGWSGFATRVFMDFPIKNRKDFLEMKKRYNPDEPERYPRNWSELARTYNHRDYPLSITIRGPFWWARDMIGLKGISVGIHEKPELMKEIIDFCAEFQVETLRKALDDIEVDYVILNEDMAYKKGPMISPKTVKSFMGSAYRQLATFFRKCGARVVFVDSDGNIESLIPVWLEFGINGITPCEVAAGIDVVEIGRKYPNLVMMGGIDKRQLSSDQISIRREVMYKVPPLVQRMGYFPGVDHAVPPDISLANFKHFVLLLKKICGWTN